MKKHNLFIITLTVVTLLSGCKKYRSRGSVLSGELLRNNITKVLKEEESLNVKKYMNQLYLVRMKFITIMTLH